MSSQRCPIPASSNGWFVVAAAFAVTFVGFGCAYTFSAFLDSLPKPQIVVPGNHDIPLHNLFARFARPLDKYRRYITEDMQPFYADDEIAVIGINTARSLTTKYGRINERQIASQPVACLFKPRSGKRVQNDANFNSLALILQPQNS